VHGESPMVSRVFPQLFPAPPMSSSPVFESELQIQICVGITKLRGTSRSHLDCFLVIFLAANKYQYVTTVNELCFLTFFHAQKTIAESHRMLKDPFQKLLQQCQCVTKVPKFPVKICFTKFSQVCLQTKAQRSIWSQAGGHGILLRWKYFAHNCTFLVQLLV